MKFTVYRERERERERVRVWRKREGKNKEVEKWDFRNGGMERKGKKRGRERLTVSETVFLHCVLYLYIYFFLII